MLALEPLVDVWRVELRDGGGPYLTGRTWTPWGERARQHCVETGHPDPESNGLDYDLVWDSKHHYGFATLAALYEWFDADDRRLLAGDRYQIVHFRAPKSSTHYGRQQLLFLRELSVEVSRHPIA